MDELFAGHIGITRTPFSSRLRHGFVMASDNETCDALSLEQLDGAAFIRAAYNAILRRDPDETGEGTYLALLSRRELSKREILDALLASDEYRKLRGPPEAEGAARPAPPPIEPRAQERPLSGFAAEEDWDNPAWSRYLQAYPGHPRDNLTWRRVQLLYGLERSGKLTPAARVLVAAAKPDPAIAALSEYVGCVEVIDLDGAAPRQAAAARLYWADGMLYARDRLVPLDRSDPALEAEGYDTVFFADPETLGDGLAGAGMLLAAADRVLKTDGMLVFAADIALGAEPHPFLIDESLLSQGGLAAHIEECTGFAVDGGFDARIAPATPEDTGAQRQYGGRVVMPSLWFLRKRGTTVGDGWRRLEGWLADRVLGEQIQRLLIGAAGRRASDGAILTAPGRKGHVFFGPYLALPPGHYEASIGFESGRTKRNGITIDVVAGAETFAVQRPSPRVGYHRLHISFEIPPPRTPPRLRKVEIRAWADGVDAAFRECRLDRAGPGGSETDSDHGRRE